MNNYMEEQLVKFSRYLKETRKRLGYTLDEVAELSYLSKATIWRLENNEVLPQYDTLTLLSNVYKVELLKVLDNFRLEESPEFTYIENKINKSIESGDIYRISKGLEKLLEYKLIMNSSGNYSLDKHIEQLYLFTEASILMFRNKLNLSLSKFIDGLKVTNDNFNIDSIDKIKMYSDFETRILLSIASVFRKKDNYKKAREILNICSNYTVNPRYKTIILNNYSSILYEENSYSEALVYLNKAIKLSRMENIYDLLPYIYYSKSINEIQLEKNYSKSLETLKYLCIAFGKDDLYLRFNKEIEKYERSRAN